MANDIHQMPWAVNQYLVCGAAGLVPRGSQHRTVSAINKRPQAKQITTMAVSTGTASSDYVFTLNGYEFTYSNPSGVTNTTTIAAAIVSAANADPRIRQWVTLTNNTNTITFTAHVPGLAFTLTESDSKLGSPSTTTAAATATAIPFGRACIRLSNSGSIAKAIALADDGILTAQTADVAMTYTSGATTTVTVTVPALARSWSFPIAHSTDSSTTGGLLATAVTNSSLNDYVTATNASGTVTFEAAFAGLGFAITSTRYGVASGTVEPAPDSDLRKALFGFSVQRQDVASSVLGATPTEYPANSGVEVLVKGPIWVESTETVTHASDVFIGTATDEEGLVFASSGTGRIKIVDGSVRWETPALRSDGFNLIYVNLA